MVLAFFQRPATQAAISPHQRRTRLTALGANAIVMPQIGSPALLPSRTYSFRRGTKDPLRRLCRQGNGNARQKDEWFRPGFLVHETSLQGGLVRGNVSCAPPLPSANPIF